MSNPFQVMGGQAFHESAENKALDLNLRLKNLINAAPVMLFMKGTPDMPQCGFSANVCKILNHVGASYMTFNILADMDVREGLKQFSNWPTFPQLYIKGELIGGNDIVTEMMNSGELLEALKA
jgi:monothiol glutaredoxin